MSGLSFSRRPRGPGSLVDRRVVVMAVVLVVAAALLVVRARTEPPTRPPPIRVQVEGHVPAPGVYELSSPASVAEALAAASASGGDTRQLVDGDRVVVDGDGTVRVDRMDTQLVLGLPVDVNRASVAALEAVPGLGPQRAAAIVAARQTGGPFEDLEALTRVRGIGPATVEDLRPFLVARPVDGAAVTPLGAP